MKLGNILETIFTYTGIRWIVKKLYPDCKCDKRKDKLNNFKFKRK
jgi:hypothetical protein